MSPRDESQTPEAGTARLMGRVHDALESSGCGNPDLGRLLVRIVFCLFADDTGIFEPRGIFLDLIEQRTSPDGADLGPWLAKLFRTIDIPEAERRTTLDEDLARFPHIDGALFGEPLRIPSFDAATRTALLDACRFDWSDISPAILGSLFQSVMAPDMRRAQGVHYTTERNILKVVEPLFLEDLRTEFDRIRRGRNPVRDLERFRERLGELHFLDPACGCGNFLVIALRELRLLEIEVIRAIRKAGEPDAGRIPKVNADQFHGIEIGEFPVRIAETALRMTDRIMNNRLSREFGRARIPPDRSPRIIHADALETDWKQVLPPERCFCILGNPPFGGFVLRTPGKRKRTMELMKRLGASGGRLDHAAAWFLKAGDYLRGHPARIGLVATSSLTQGEQVGQLWPALLDRHRLEIAFAHRTFAWGSDARGKARVHVVILGLSDRNTVPNQRRLFIHRTPADHPEEVRVRSISPYLLDAGGLANPHLVVERMRTSLSGLPAISVGTKPVDGGHYLFSEEEKDAFLEREPSAAPLFRPFPGSAEFIRNRKRWILHVAGRDPARLHSMPAVMERIRRVGEYRANESGRLGASLSDRPTEYHVQVVPEGPFLAIPETSSERRTHVPVGWLEPPTIPSNALLVIPDAPQWLFGLLISSMHMTWLRLVGGRLESRYRYSGGLVYNTFPAPPGLEADEGKRTGLEKRGQAVLDARAGHPGASLADLYDPDLMPTDLHRAHRALDRTVESLYRRGGFASERERTEHLLHLHERRRAPLETGMARTSGHRSRRVRGTSSRTDETHA